MKSSRSSRASQLLERFDPGERYAGEQLFADVYAELRALAARYLHRERKSHTLQPTALVHEAYLKLVDQTGVDWQDRAHFLAIAAHAMRQILVDHARRHRAAKRGGNRHRIALDDSLAVESRRDVDLLALEDALTKLTKLDPRQAQMIELRFFGGLSIAEVAKVMAISKRSVEREWTMVRAWLRRELGRGDAA
ncbi:MAG: sigma-70 family RNA polymerase sigma factor [Thermoguttaceae bacterium]|jgi:RNA polymerase sigma factor (TIGR02999 family)